MSAAKAYLAAVASILTGLVAAWPSGDNLTWTEVLIALALGLATGGGTYAVRNRPKGTTTP